MTTCYPKSLSTIALEVAMICSQQVAVLEAKWRLRLRMLKAIHASGGRTRRAAQIIGIDRSTLYRHRRDPLFNACCEWVIQNAAASQSWEEFWPHRLPPMLKAELIESALLFDIREWAVPMRSRP